MYEHKKLSKQQYLKQLKGNWTVAEIEISYKPIITDHTVITSSYQAYELIKRLWDKEKISLQEQFAALFFNAANKMIGYRVITTGTMKGCIVDVKLLVSLALHCLSSYIMIVHNHPSGNLKPSNADIALTLKIQEALKLIDVELLDHITIVDDGFASFKETGLL